MHLHTPYEDIREADYSVSINPSNGNPFATIEMGNACTVELTGSRADMQRLLKAAALAVAMFDAQDKPHEPERGAGPHGSHCQVCGLLVHKHPEPCGEPEPALEGTVTAPPQDAPYAEAICGAVLPGPVGLITCGLKPGHDGDHIHATGGPRYRWPRQASEFADETATAGAR